MFSIGFRAVIGAAALLWAGAASAVTFDGTGTVSDTIPSSPAGPAISFSNSNPFNVNTGNLNLGDVFNGNNLFKISVTSSSLGNTGTDTLDVLFNFTLPSVSSGTLAGTAVGHTSQENGYLVVTWDNPLLLNFGNHVGLLI